MTRTKLAVVGCGHLGVIHARLLAGRDDAELVAVLDWLTAQSFHVPHEQQDSVLLLRDCLRAKAHR